MQANKQFSYGYRLSYSGFAFNTGVLFIITNAFSWLFLILKCAMRYKNQMPFFMSIRTINRAGGMSSQLIRPNLTMRPMQLNAWVADNIMSIEILFLPLSYTIML